MVRAIITFRLKYFSRIAENINGWKMRKMEKMLRMWKHNNCFRYKALKYFRKFFFCSVHHENICFMMRMIHSYYVNKTF